MNSSLILFMINNTFGYFYLLNDNNDNDNNTPGTTVEDVFMDTKGVEYFTIVPNATNNDDNDEENDDDTEDDDSHSDTLDTISLQDFFL